MTHAVDARSMVPRRLAEWSKRPDGRVTVRRPKGTAAGRVVFKVLRMPTQLTVHLDPLGSDVWLLIDGKRTAADILERLRQRHPRENRLDERLGQYLSSLAANQLVRLD
jgi:hypothetical protein